MTEVYWADIAWSAVAVVLLGVAVLALFQIARTPSLTSLGKAGWVLLVVLVPLIGGTAWFVFKPSKAIPRTQ